MELSQLQSELQSVFSQVQEKSTTVIATLKDLLAKSKDDYAKADNPVAFAKAFITEELLEKKERIPATAITIWTLIVWIVAGKFYYAFWLGIMPVVIYYLVQFVKKAPENEF